MTSTGHSSQGFSKFSGAVGGYRIDHYFVLYNPDIFEIFYNTHEGGFTNVC